MLGVIEGVHVGCPIKHMMRMIERTFEDAFGDFDLDNFVEQLPGAILDFVHNFHRYLMMAIHALLMHLEAFMYYTRIAPVEIFEKSRDEFCGSVPEYGSKGHENLLDNHPVVLFYCSNWVTERVHLLEQLFEAPAFMVKDLVNAFNAKRKEHHGKHHNGDHKGGRRHHRNAEPVEEFLDL